VAAQYDVVVAGGGIAGLTAGLTAARLGRRTLVLTGGVPGGLLLSIDRIDGYPGFPEGVPGYELCPLTQQQAMEAGAEFSMAELRQLAPANGHLSVATSEGELETRSAILATGARFCALGVPGEERLTGRGVSNCASCDAPLFRDRTAAVVGGGDSGLQEALTLAESLARVVVLEQRDGLTGQESYRRAVTEHPKIEVQLGVTVDEILGDTNVTGVRTRRLGDGSTGELEVDAVFAFVGLEPNTQTVQGLVELTATGQIATDSELRTSVPGVFAAGIVRAATPGRAAASAGDGAVAAVGADAYITNGR
jgi:thioredoxin reductase (NADPH)